MKEAIPPFLRHRLSFTSSAWIWVGVCLKILVHVGNPFVRRTNIPYVQSLIRFMCVSTIQIFDEGDKRMIRFYRLFIWV